MSRKNPLVMPAMSALVLVVAALCAVVRAQPAVTGTTFDHSIPPGQNFDKADFRLWLPPGREPVRAIVLLVPGSNGDARNETDDGAWQAFAVKHRLALVGVHLTDKRPSPFEEYADVAKGSGDAILRAIGALGSASSHPELATAPLFLWGMSAGGEVNYELVAWEPERVAAFVVNKGGIYYTALAQKAARGVPGLLFIGGKDLASRIDIITGLFALNRRGGALWALAEEPGAAHIVGKSKDLAMMFFEDVMPMRLGEGGALKPVAEADGFVADIHAKTFARASAAPGGNVTNAWLPSERVAQAWQTMETDKHLAP